MSGRRIRKTDHGVVVELMPREPSGGDVETERSFSEVRLLSSGWVECRDPEDGSDRREFFPPARVAAVRVEDEDEPSAWM